MNERRTLVPLVFAWAATYLFGMVTGAGVHSVLSHPPRQAVVGIPTSSVTYRPGVAHLYASITKFPLITAEDFNRLALEVCPSANLRRYVNGEILPATDMLWCLQVSSSLVRSLKDDVGEREARIRALQSLPAGQKPAPEPWSEPLDYYRNLLKQGYFPIGGAGR